MNRGMMKLVEIWTAHVNYDPLDKDRINTTVKSGDKTFAPTWEMVMNHKRRKISNDEYKKMYIDLMRKSRKENPERWNEVLSMKRVVLVCYCEEGLFCHRILLAKMLEKLGGKYMGEISIGKMGY
ncbi:hypothetical protein D3C81_1508970 [compost metagenome]